MTRSQPAALLTTPCLRIGGTEVQTLALSKALLSDGWNVKVLVVRDDLSPAMREEFERSGVPVTCLAIPRAVSLPVVLARLTRVFRGMPVDVVHVQYMTPGFTAILAARLAGCRRVMATVHQTGNAGEWKSRRLLRSAALMCDVFLCNSLATEERWFGSSRLYNPATDLRPRGHRTLYNGVDVRAIAETAARTDRAGLLRNLDFDRRPVIGVVGRLSPEKGQQTAVRALQALLCSYPTAGLLLVGDGQDRDRLARLCHDVGVVSAVRFVGEAPPATVAAWYGAIDVLAVPSFHEGFGLVAVEGMAAGVPIVASSVPALAEVLGGGQTGVLTPPGDSDALAAGLHQVLSDTGFAGRMRQAAFARAEQLFSKPVFDRNAAAIHRSMLSQ